MASAEPVVHQTADAVRGAGVEGAKRGRKAARTAREACEARREVDAEVGRSVCREVRGERGPHGRRADQLLIARVVVYECAAASTASTIAASCDAS